MSSADILVRGRNRELLFEKLKRARVHILRSDTRGDDLIIRVKYKDLKKAFAIFGNMWYNKVIGIHGAAALFAFLKRHVAIAVSVAVFCVSAFAVDDYIFFIGIEGVSKAESLAITSLLNEKGVRPFARASSLDVKRIKSDIMASDDNIVFAGVEKRANTLFVEIKKGEGGDSGHSGHKIVYSVVAKESGVIKDISVLRGRALKKVGDFVYAGEVVIDGATEYGEEVFEDRAAGRFSVECERSFETAIADTSEETIRRETARLVAMIDRDGARAQTEIVPAGGGYILIIKVTYSVTESGGYFEQNDR